MENGIEHRLTKGQHHHRHQEKILMLQSQDRKQFQLTHIKGHDRKSRDE